MTANTKFGLENAVSPKLFFSKRFARPAGPVRGLVFSGLGAI